MGFFAKAAQQSEIAMAIALISIVAMLILPLPEWLLDFCLVVNLTGAVLILLTALYTTEPLQFSVFPALLLVTTLFRLALEVSAMKLIIGTGSAGHVIATFGQVVVGGSYVVGIIVFLLLVVVQFVVITAGAGRVAEVAARFTLDAMPGKQMAIDADMNAGLINQEQARERRKQIGREADFYGAMDGANKFVRGDAMAAIVIIVLNILGGFAMGLSKGEDVMKVLQNYTLLTVGEGLVAQIPALLISTAAGLMVTRAASETPMGGDIARQMFHSPRPLFIAAGLVCLFIPFGFPLPQTLFIAGILVSVGLMLVRTDKQALMDQEEAAAVSAAPARPPRPPRECSESAQRGRAGTQLRLRPAEFGGPERRRRLIGPHHHDSAEDRRRTRPGHSDGPYSGRPAPAGQRLRREVEGRDGRVGHRPAQFADADRSGQRH